MKNSYSNSTLQNKFNFKIQKCKLLNQVSTAEWLAYLLTDTCLTYNGGALGNADTTDHPDPLGWRERWNRITKTRCHHHPHNWRKPSLPCTCLSNLPKNLLKKLTRGSSYLHKDKVLQCNIFFSSHQQKTLNLPRHSTRQSIVHVLICTFCKMLPA